MDKETAIKKIQKCMALAKSSEPNEAAAALRQAQKLMQQFGIDHPELMAANVSEDWSKSASSKKPSSYEVNLASMVCSLFGCDLMFSQRIGKSILTVEGGYSFIGTAPSPEIAAYTFSVLRRQISKARNEYIKTALKRHRKNKTAAADTFCLGWVSAARRQISFAERTAEQTDAIKAYKLIHYPNAVTLDPRERTLKKNADDHRFNGWREGSKAKVHHGVGTEQQLQLN